jgi:preprotein translocase subunit SecB
VPKRKKVAGKTKKAPSAERRVTRDRRTLVPPAPLALEILSIGLRDIAFRELMEPAAAMARPEGARIPQVAFEISASIDFPGPQIATLTVHGTARDAAPEPLAEVELQMTAVFKHGPHLSQRAVGTYLSKMGGNILFPYIRETVHSVTSRGFFQPMLLTPRVITNLFTDAQLATLPDSTGNSLGSSPTRAR